MSHATELQTLKLQQSEDINDLRIQIKTYVETTKSRLDKLQLTMDELLYQRRLETEISSLTMLDRWSAGCMEDHDHDWLQLLQKLFPEVKLHKSDLPDIRAIQKDNGY